MSLLDKLPRPAWPKKKDQGSEPANAASDVSPTVLSSARSNRPTSTEIASEIKARRRNKRILGIVGSTIAALLTVASIVVLLATFVFPTLRIYGTSMTPTLKEGEIAVMVKTPTYHTGDVIAFYYNNNKILVKRVICGPGDWFDMQRDGTVYVNNDKLEESYVSESGFGSCDIELPYQVPDGEYFVPGDKRMSSIDSRMSQVGCVPVDRIVGKVMLRVWPLESIGVVE